MAIILRLDRVMADRKMSLNDLAEKVGITNANLSKIKTGKISAIRFSTLDAICKILSCQPGDILEYQPDTIQTKEESKMKSEVQLVEVGTFMTLQEAGALEAILKENDIPYVKKSESMGGYYGMSVPVMNGIHIYISDEDVQRFEELGE